MWHLCKCDTCQATLPEVNHGTGKQPAFNSRWTRSINIRWFQWKQPSDGVGGRLWGGRHSKESQRTLNSKHSLCGLFGGCESLCWSISEGTGLHLLPLSQTAEANFRNNCRLSYVKTDRLQEQWPFNLVFHSRLFKIHILIYSSKEEYLITKSSALREQMFMVFLWVMPNCFLHVSGFPWSQNTKSQSHL